jgi:hypothetical protein
MNDLDTRQWRNTIMTIANLASRAPSPSELLDRLGLERRRSLARRSVSRAGWIGLGMAFGTGLTMLFTPRSGPEVRESLSERAKKAREYVAPSDEDQTAESRAQNAPGSRVPRRT